MISGRHAFVYCGLRFALLAALLMSPVIQAQDPPKAAYPNYPSETPDNFLPVTDSYDYISRDVMIAMRDGVKLHGGWMDGR